MPILERFLPTLKTFQRGWFERCRQLFLNYFARRQPVPVITNISTVSSKGVVEEAVLKSVAAIAASRPPTSTPRTNLTQSTTPATKQKAEMHIGAIKAAAARVPMIKFVGARLPRAHFDKSSLPPIQISGNFSSGKSSVADPPAAAKATSIGAVGKIPRGSGIEETQLPYFYRRRPISEEECEAINSGFAYNR